MTRTNTVTNAELETTQIKYNQRFQVFEVKDALNQVYTFSYDPLGRMLSQTRAGGTMSFQFDEVGNIKERVDYMGRKTKYTHDNLNRLTQIDYLPTSEAGVTPKPEAMPNEKVTYGYDEISRLTSATNSAGTVLMNYDNRNRLINTTDVFGHLVEYEYERTSAVNQRRVKFDGALYAVYNFDDAERLANIVNSSDSSTVTFGYDNEDKVISRAYPNGVTTTYQYFDNDLLKRITDVNSSTTLFDRHYTYNSARQIQQIIEPNRSRTFGYDDVDRLTSVTDATYGNESYSFDGVGNRLTSHLASSYGYQAGQFNRLISATTPTQTVTYSHDANGNTMTKAEGSQFWRYTWDYENRMAEASTRKEKVRYKFDALGRRVQRIVRTENTKFIHDGLDVLVDDDGGTLTKYLNGTGIDNKLRVQTGTTVNYFLADHLGSTNGLTDASGAITSQTAYDSFGNQTGSLTTRYGFTGRERDDLSGLMYYRARFYDPRLGRFISEDPIGFGGGDVNLYAYVRNQPLIFRDPRGLYPGLDVMSNTGALSQAVAALGTAGGAIITAAGAAATSPLAVGAGGLAIGVGIGLPVGIYTANHPSNPFVNGPLNPFGPPASAGRPISPSSISRPYCQPMSRVIPFPTPAGAGAPPVPPSQPPPDRVERCKSALQDCLASSGGDLIMQGKCAASFTACVNSNLPVIFPNGIWVP